MRKLLILSITLIVLGGGFFGLNSYLSKKHEQMLINMLANSSADCVDVFKYILEREKLIDSSSDNHKFNLNSSVYFADDKKIVEGFWFWDKKININKINLSLELGSNYKDVIYDLSKEFIVDGQITVNSNLFAGKIAFNSNSPIHITEKNNIMDKNTPNAEVIIDEFSSESNFSPFILFSAVKEVIFIENQDELRQKLFKLFATNSKSVKTHFKNFVFHVYEKSEDGKGGELKISFDDIISSIDVSIVNNPSNTINMKYGMNITFSGLNFDIDALHNNNELAFLKALKDNWPKNHKKITLKHDFSCEAKDINPEKFDNAIEFVDLFIHHKFENYISTNDLTLGDNEESYLKHLISIGEFQYMKNESIDDEEIILLFKHFQEEIQKIISFNNLQIEYRFKISPEIINHITKIYNQEAHKFILAKMFVDNILKEEGFLTDEGEYHLSVEVPNQKEFEKTTINGKPYNKAFLGIISAFKEGYKN